MGISPLEFWQLTPLEFFKMVDGYIKRENRHRDDMIAAAYLGASLQRSKKMPKLKDLLSTSEKKRRPTQTSAEMLEKLKEINKALGGKVVYKEGVG